MEMGLDSADLLELNERISHEFSVRLEPAFSFNIIRRSSSLLTWRIRLPLRSRKPKRRLPL